MKNASFKDKKMHKTTKLRSHNSENPRRKGSLNSCHVVELDDREQTRILPITEERYFETTIRPVRGIQNDNSNYDNNKSQDKKKTTTHKALESKLATA